MNIFIEILKGILPACITGLITFLVTKYTYNRNIPIDKYEIAYNRVYYPIGCLLCDSEERQQVIEKSRYYLKKYNKYVDKTTMVAFKFLQENPELKKAYDNYNENISYVSSKLRRRLGYLESSILNMYTYSAPREKRAFRMVFELLGSYLPLLVFTTINLKVIRNIMVVIWCISIVALMIECMIVICLFVAKQVKKYIKKGTMLNR